jgi:MFS family permease
MHATTVATPVPATRFNPFISRDFGLLWAGQAVSNLGDMVFDTTVALWIVSRLAHDQSWAPLAVSGVLIAASLPYLLVGPLVGVFVDRLDKRRLMLRMDAIRAILIGLLAVWTGAVTVPLLQTPHPPESWQLGGLYVTIFLSGICAQFFGPARLAIIGELVPEGQRARASGLAQFTSSLALIVGPTIAAPVYFQLGPGGALVANALSFVASFAVIAAVRFSSPPHSVVHEPGAYRHELLEGFRYFAGNRPLVVVVTTACLVMLGGGCLNALDIFFLGQNLHASTTLYGLMSGVSGAGLLIGAVLASMYAERIGIARVFWLGLVSVGLAVLVYARLSSFAPALVVLFFMGVPNAAVNVALGPLVLRHTPPHLVGRIAAVLHPAITLSMLLSAAAAGALASTVMRGVHFSLLGVHWTTIDLIFTWTGLIIVVGGLFARANLQDQDPATVKG